MSELLWELQVGMEWMLDKRADYVFKMNRLRTDANWTIVD